MSKDQHLPETARALRGANWSTKAELALVAAASAFGLWTLACHAAVFGGLPFASLSLSLPLVLLAAVLVTASVGRTATWPDTEFAHVAPRALPQREFALTLGCAIAALLALALRVDERIWWGLALSAVFVGLRTVRYDATAPDRPREERLEQMFWVLPVCCGIAVTVTLLAHRADIDDAFYLSIMQGALAAPGRPPMAEDGMYGDPGLPLLMSIYRLNSYELLLASVAQWTRLPALDVAYIWMPAVSAIFVVLAWHVLLKDLLGGAWPLALAVVLALLLLNGDRHAGLANFGFVRIHQGKALFVSVALPLLLWLMQRVLAGAPGPLRVAAAFGLIGAVGLTSWALLTVPFLAGVTASCAWLRDRRALRNVLALVPALVYLAVMAVLARSELQIPDEYSDYQWTMHAAIDRVFGEWSRYPMLFAMIGGWALLDDSRTRALLVTSSLALLLGPMNPLLTRVIAEYVTTVPTFWRIFWLFPFLLFEVVLVIGLLRQMRPPALLRRGAVAASLVAVLAANLIPPYVLSAGNRVVLAAPGWKIAHDELRVAQLVASMSTASDKVVAPDPVASVLAILDRRPMLVIVRSHYLELQRQSFDPADYAERRQVARQLATPPLAAFDEAALTRLLERHRPAVFVVSRASPHHDRFHETLVRNGYAPAAGESGYDVYAGDKASRAGPGPSGEIPPLRHTT